MTGAGDAVAPWLAVDRAVADDDAVLFVHTPRRRNDWYWEGLSTVLLRDKGKPDDRRGFEFHRFSPLAAPFAGLIAVIRRREPTVLRCEGESAQAIFREGETLDHFGSIWGPDWADCCVTAAPPPSDAAGAEGGEVPLGLSAGGPA